MNKRATTSRLNSIYISKDVPVCCCCLATEGTATTLEAAGMVPKYNQLTSGLELGDVTKWHICCLCIYKLRKFSAFQIQLKENAYFIQEAYEVNNYKIMVTSGDPVSRLSLLKTAQIHIDFPASKDTVNSLQKMYEEDDLDDPNKRIAEEKIFDGRKYDGMNDSKFEIELIEPCDDDRGLVPETNAKYMELENDSNYGSASNVDYKYKFNDVMECDYDDTKLQANHEAVDVDDEQETDEETNDDDDVDFDYTAPECAVVTHKSGDAKRDFERLNQTFKIQLAALLRKFNKVSKENNNMYRKLDNLSKVFRCEEGDDEFSKLAVDTPTRRIMVEVKNSLAVLSKAMNHRIEYPSVADYKREIQDRLNSERYRKAKHKCDICYMVFRFQETLNAHMSHHDESMAFECELCMRRYRTHRALYHHVNSRHSFKLSCNSCKVFNRIWSQARDHWISHSQSLQCRYCKKSFGVKKLYCYHLRSAHHDEMEMIACMLCGDKYIGEQGLKIHMNRAHADAICCEICKNLFKTDEALTAHKEIGCQTGCSSCPICGLNFSTGALTMEHYLAEHHKSLQYTCVNCERCFDNPKQYKIHKQMCCPESDRKVKARTRRFNHKEQYTGTDIPGMADLPKRGSFVCEVCGKTELYKVRLIDHMRLHTGERPFQCSVCPKRFRTGLLLHCHESTHQSARRYPCTLCPYAARTSAHLTSHMLKHTGEKAHECQLCHKRYGTKQTLKEHTRTVHEGLPPYPRNRYKKQ